MILRLRQSGGVFRTGELFDWVRERGLWKEKKFELEALNLFAVMQKKGVGPNFPSPISVLSVCASMVSIGIHAKLVSFFISSRYSTNSGSLSSRLYHLIAGGFGMLKDLFVNKWSWLEEKIYLCLTCKCSVSFSFELLLLSSTVTTRIIRISVKKNVDENSK